MSRCGRVGLLGVSVRFPSRKALHDRATQDQNGRRDRIPQTAYRSRSDPAGATKEHQNRYQKDPVVVPQSYQKNRRTITKLVEPIRKRVDSSVPVSRLGKPVIFSFCCGLNSFDHHFDALDLTQQTCTGMERITSEVSDIVAFHSSLTMPNTPVYPDYGAHCINWLQTEGQGARRQGTHKRNGRCNYLFILDYASEVRFQRSKSVYEIWLPPKRSKALPTVTSNLPELASRIRFKSSIDATPPA